MSVSHHRLLTRGHNLAVLSIMPFSILETCHVIVNHAPAVRNNCAVIVTSTLSSSHADSYRLDRSILYRVAYSACIVFWQIVVQHICILITKCVSSAAGNRLIHTSFMLRNVLIISKGTIARYKWLIFIVEYVISGPDNRSGEE